MNRPQPVASPFLNHPPLKEDATKPGLFCFLDQRRPCGPDCMAYETAPDSPDYKDKQWATCMLLVNTHRAGKHLVVLASVAGQQLQNARAAAADALRTNQPMPPKVG